jgi:hypothetical protein
MCLQTLRWFLNVLNIVLNVKQWGTYDLISVSLKMAQLGPKHVWGVNLTSV